MRLRLRQLALITCWTQKQASWLQAPSLRRSQVRAGGSRMLGPLAISSKTARPTTSNVCVCVCVCNARVARPAYLGLQANIERSWQAQASQAAIGELQKLARHALRQGVLSAQAHDGAHSQLLKEAQSGYCILVHTVWVYTRTARTRTFCTSLGRKALNEVKWPAANQQAPINRLMTKERRKSFFNYWFLNNGKRLEHYNKYKIIILKTCSY